ncbi:MAG: hypothetical protein WA147_03965 [Polaromonas sp.]
MDLVIGPDLGARNRNQAKHHNAHAAHHRQRNRLDQRAEPDAYAIESHRRAEAARAAGLQREILPMPGVDKEGQPLTLAHDEGICAVIDTARMRAMLPVFCSPETGVVTAANAAQDRGLKPRALGYPF